MADEFSGSAVLAALLAELSEQGLGPADSSAGDPVSSYSVHGTIDVQALAEAVENALGGRTLDEAKSPAALNAANDG
jgi:hypothetical protein